MKLLILLVLGCSLCSCAKQVAGGESAEHLQTASAKASSSDERQIGEVQESTTETVKRGPFGSQEKSNKLSTSLSNEQQALNECMLSREFDQALTLIDLLEKEFSEGGEVYSGDKKRIEALIGLNRIEDAANLIVKTGRKLSDFPIVLALQGRLNARDAKQFLFERSDFYSSEDFSQLIVGVESDAVAMVRLARAIDANGRDSLIICRAEAMEVLKRVKDQPLASYLVADAYALEGKHREANEYWRKASSLPGLMGRRAMQGAEAKLPPDSTLEG